MGSMLLFGLGYLGDGMECQRRIRSKGWQTSNERKQRHVFGLALQTDAVSVATL